MGVVTVVRLTLMPCALCLGSAKLAVQCTAAATTGNSPEVHQPRGASEIVAGQPGHVRFHYFVPLVLLSESVFVCRC